jgi:AcrR family transcriptional regulator
MRSIQRDTADLTTQARIRDAAVDLFGRAGFAHVTVRQIATEAGVSPGLVIHHFGSKEGLREACDAYVQQVFSDAIDDMERRGPASAMAQLAHVEQYLPPVRYGTRALKDGGPLATALFGRLVGDTRTWLASSVASGQVRPSDDEHARATLLVCISLGIQMLSDHIAPQIPPGERDVYLVGALAGAAVELYTHGLFTGTEFLDAFRRQQSARAEDSEPQGDRA